MKILVLPSWYKTAKYPENCIFIYEQVAGLAELGHNVIVISPQQNFNPLCSRNIYQYNDGTCDLLYRNYLVIWPSKFPFQNLYSFERCAMKLAEKAINDYGVPDVIYAHFSIPAGYAATKLGEKYGIPVVVEEHLSDLMNEKWDKFRYSLMKTTIEKADKFICVSEGLKKSIENKLGEYGNMIVVSNMINQCFRYYPLENKEFVFLAIGGLIPRKGFDFLIRCFTKVFKGKNVKLRIAGQGRMRKDLEELIKDLDIESQVSLLGQLSRVETLEQYKNCSCFVLTSQAETFGLVYREALAVGRPIISTRHGGFSDKDWHDEYGYLIDYGNCRELKEAMFNVFNDFQKFDLKKISNICLSTCSKTIVMNSIEKILVNTNNNCGLWK